MSNLYPDPPLLRADLPEAEYHAHPALSSSGARKLLAPSCPAIFKWERDHPPSRAVFDFGRAAHAAVLGVGGPICVVDADDWRTKAAREARDEAHAAGQTPLLAADAQRVEDMALALREHPLAAKLLDPSTGRPEVSAFWHDERHGIDRRARFDWLPHATDGGDLVVPDYKSTASAESRKFARSIFDYGYDVQAVYYADAIRALGLADEVRFLFIAQEKTPPYLTAVYELDAYALAVGRKRVDEACALFRQCSETDQWPGYSPDVEYVSPPPWLAEQYGLDDMELVL